MQKHVSELRLQYQGEVLDEKLVSKEPLMQFKKWFKEIIDARIQDPNAMIIATANKMERHLLELCS